MEPPVVINSQGQKIYGNLGLPHKKAPCVLMSHGFEGNKDSIKWLTLSSRLGEAGFASLRFNYRGCGEGEEKSEGEFEDTNLTGRISDYQAAIDFIQRIMGNRVKLGVIGSSFGGMVALAARDKRVRAMVTLAAPTHFPSPDGKIIKHVEEKDRYEFSSGKRLRGSFYQDLGRYNIHEAIEGIHCPLLIIHGSSDGLVPVEQARELYRYANEPKRLEIIEGANHIFDDPEHLDKVISLCRQWFKKYLQEETVGINR